MTSQVSVLMQLKESAEFGLLLDPFFWFVEASNGHTSNCRCEINEIQ